MMPSPPLSRKRVVDDWSTNGESPPARKINGCVETLKFVIHDFENRTWDGKSINSKTLKAQGRDWRIEILLGHYQNPSHLGCYLNNIGTDPVTVSFTLVCKNRRWKRNHSMKPNQARGCHKFLEWSEIVEDFLDDDGCLVIEVDMVWYPPAFQRQSVLVEMYQDASSDTADVVFCVGKDEKEYKAHKSILSHRCKMLYEIARECDRKERFNHPIVINSIREEVFKAILDFAYTVKYPVPESKDFAKELLVASDRVGCVKLKLFVESFIADKFLAPENAAELLLLADSRSCALLKEAATNMFVLNPECVKKGEVWYQVFQSNRLITEWLDALAHSNNISDEKGSTTEDCATMNVATLPNKIHDENLELEDYATMNVATLRNKLQDEKLEVDGSREVLVQRLKDFDEKENKRSQETEKYFADRILNQKNKEME